MKKNKRESNDWLRPEYKRSDFGDFKRGKYASRLKNASNIVLLDPRVAKVFPNDKAVNTVLLGLIGMARSSIRAATR